MCRPLVGLSMLESVESDQLVSKHRYRAEVPRLRVETIDARYGFQSAEGAGQYVQIAYGLYVLLKLCARIFASKKRSSALRSRRLTSRLMFI